MDVSSGPEPEPHGEEKAVEKDDAAAQQAVEVDGGPTVAEDRPEQEQVIPDEIGGLPPGGARWIQAAPEVALADSRGGQPRGDIVVGNDRELHPVGGQASRKSNDIVGFKTVGNQQIHWVRYLLAPRRERP